MSERTADELVEEFTEAIKRHPLPQPDIEEMAMALLARKEELRFVIASMTLNEISEVVKLPHYTRLPSIVTKTIIEDLIARLEVKEAE